MLAAAAQAHAGASHATWAAQDDANTSRTTACKTIQQDLRAQHLALFRGVLLNTVYHPHPGTVDGHLQGSGSTLTIIGQRRLDAYSALVATAIEDGVPGHVIDTGADAAAFMAAKTLELMDSKSFGRQVFVTQRNHGRHEHNATVSMNRRQRDATALGMDLQRVAFVFGGTLPALLRETTNLQFAVVRIDGANGPLPVHELIELLYPRLLNGGFLIVDDYIDVAATRDAIDHYRLKFGISEPIVLIPHAPVDHSHHGIFWRKKPAPHQSLCAGCPPGALRPAGALLSPSSNADRLRDLPNGLTVAHASWHDANGHPWQVTIKGVHACPGTGNAAGMRIHDQGRLNLTIVRGVHARDWQSSSKRIHDQGGLNVTGWGAHSRAAQHAASGHTPQISDASVGVPCNVDAQCPSRKCRPRNPSDTAMPLSKGRCYLSNGDRQPAFNIRGERVHAAAHTPHAALQRSPHALVHPHAAVHSPPVVRDLCPIGKGQRQWSSFVITAGTSQSRTVDMLTKLKINSTTLNISSALVSEHPVRPSPFQAARAGGSNETGRRIKHPTQRMIFDAIAQSPGPADEYVLVLEEGMMLSPAVSEWRVFDMLACGAALSLRHALPVFYAGACHVVDEANAASLSPRSSAIRVHARCAPADAVLFAHAFAIRRGDASAKARVTLPANSTHTSGILYEYYTSADVRLDKVARALDGFYLVAPEVASPHDPNTRGIFYQERVVPPSMEVKRATGFPQRSSSSPTAAALPAPIATSELRAAFRRPLTTATAAAAPTPPMVRIQQGKATRMRPVQPDLMPSVPRQGPPPAQGSWEWQ